MPEWEINYWLLFFVSKVIWSKVKDVKVRRGPEIDSDHYLVTLKWSNKKSSVEQWNKKIRSKQPEIKEKFQTLLDQKLMSMNEYSTADEMWNTYKKKQFWESAEAVEIDHFQIGILKEPIGDKEDKKHKWKNDLRG